MAGALYSRSASRRRSGLTPSSKRWLVFGVLALAVALVAVTVQQLVAIVVSAVVAAIVAILVHRSLGAAGEAPAASVEADSPEGWVEHLQQLALLNLQIREQGLAAEVVSKLEHSIDVLRRLIPELNEDHAGSELTWTVNRMASDYIRRIVSPFLALSPGARAEHQAELLESLEGLDSELENIASLLQSARVGEFKTKAAFLRARFLDPGLG